MKAHDLAHAFLGEIVYAQRHGQSMQGPLMDKAMATFDRMLELCERPWNPIDTAPKDGTRVLLFRIDWGESMAVGWYDGDWKGWRVAGSLSTAFVGPTHWAPLPKEPKW